MLLMNVVDPAVLSVSPLHYQPILSTNPSALLRPAANPTDHQRHPTTESTLPTAHGLQPSTSSIQQRPTSTAATSAADNAPVRTKRRDAWSSAHGTGVRRNTSAAWDGWWVPSAAAAATAVPTTSASPTSASAATSATTSTAPCSTYCSSTSRRGFEPTSDPSGAQHGLRRSTCTPHPPPKKTTHKQTN